MITQKADPMADPAEFLVISGSSEVLSGASELEDGSSLELDEDAVELDVVVL